MRRAGLSLVGTHDIVHGHWFGIFVPGIES
jgi:hypothetical protein